MDSVPRLGAKLYYNMRNIHLITLAEVTKWLNHHHIYALCMHAGESIRSYLTVKLLEKR